MAEAGTSYLLVKWEAPGMPNGIVTGYFLYKDGVKVYTGGGYSFNITGLQVKAIPAISLLRISLCVVM